MHGRGDGEGAAALVCGRGSTASMGQRHGLPLKNRALRLVAETLGTTHHFSVAIRRGRMGRWI